MAGVRVRFRLASKRLVGVTPEVNLRKHITHIPL